MKVADENDENMYIIYRRLNPPLISLVILLPLTNLEFSTVI